MNIENQISYWINSADRDMLTAQNLYSSGDYHWSLFIGHLVLEKSLKAIYCKDKKEIPPKTHDLVKIAKLANLFLSDEQILLYNKVNDFNIEARYPDDKYSFYQTATKDFTEKYLKLIKGELIWLKSQL